MGNPRPHPLTPTKAFDWRWNMLVIGVFFIIATGLNIGYTQQVQQQSNQKNADTIRSSQQALCPLLIPILQIPATNAISLDYHKKVYQVAVRYGCTGVPPIPSTPVPIPSSGKPSPSTTATSRP